MVVTNYICTYIIIVYDHKEAGFVGIGDENNPWSAENN